MSRALFAAVLLLPTIAVAQTTTLRAYPVPGEGALELAVPLRWLEQVAPTQPGEDARITLRPDSGSAFAFSIAVKRPDGTSDFNSRERLRALVEDSAKAALALAPGTDLRVEQVDGLRSVGFVYSVTDASVPDPAPDGFYRVMTQGAFAAGDLLLVATILTQKSWGSDLDAALDVLRSARQSDRAPDAWRLPSEQPRPFARRGALYRLDLPADWVVESENPLVAMSPIGARLEVDVDDRACEPASELRELQLAQERRSQDEIIVRRSGKTRVAGPVGREYAFVDTLRDAYVHQVVACHAEHVVTVTWSARARMARLVEDELEPVLDRLELAAIR